MRIKHQESTMCTWYIAKKELLINSSLNKNVRIWHIKKKLDCTILNFFIEISHQTITKLVEHYDCSVK